MKSILFSACIALGTMTSIAFAHDTKQPITETNKAFLTQYEAVRAALAADDLAGAKKAAAGMTEAQPAATLDAAKKLAGADSIAAARDAFKVISKRAVHLAENQEGYFHAHCPMVPNKEGDWVQTSKAAISNPYYGKKMLTCGNFVASESESDHDHH